jgi:hypothetical protein
VNIVPAGVNSILQTDLIPSDPSGILFSASVLETGGDITRCQYGYFEVIGEERIGPMDTTFRFTRLGTVTAGVYTTPASGTDTIVGPAAGTGQITGGRDVGNVLMGTTYIIRPDVAISHQYNMVAIANFAVDGAGIWAGIGAGTTRPTLKDDVQGQGSNLGAGGFDNLEGLLSKRFIDFQWVAQGEQGGYSPTDPSETPMSTSVVVTFPTKWAHYCTTSPFNRLPICSTASSGARAANDSGAPFTGWRETKGDQLLPTAQTQPYDYGEIVTLTIYDRSEHVLTPSGCAISPCPTGAIRRLPYEVNIVGLKPIDAYSEDVFDFRNNVGVPTSNAATTPAQLFFSGWAEFDLSPATGTTGDPRNIRQGKYPLTFNFYNNYFNLYRGLPAIGIVMTEFYNGEVSGYYGNTVPWQYGVDWVFGATSF